MALYYVIAAVVFHSRYVRAESPLERQQLKWLTRGTLLAVVSLHAALRIPYLRHCGPALLAKVALLSLVLLPLTFSWAIVRYRLMDVDLIFKRGVTYTLATAALVGLYFGVVRHRFEVVHTRTRPSFLGACSRDHRHRPCLRSAQAHDPGRVDRVFDQKSFDYRETLIDFGRSLNSQTDLRALVDSIVERLPQTLLVTRVAVFLAARDSPGPHRTGNPATSNWPPRMG
jgi:two-component system NtrC family sensor kinase